MRHPTMRVITWNLFHGRAVPHAGRTLLGEFARALAGWEWDVALLQEVPPWWAGDLAEAAGAEWRRVLTSRNALLPLRRAVADRWPDVIKSNGGGANAILVRGRIAEHRALRLRRLPERRMVHAVRLDGGAWVANVHATAHVPRLAEADVARAAAAASGWAGGAPLVFGGDLNVRKPVVPGLAHLAGRDVDHVLARGLVAAGRAEVLERGSLSDHPPLTVALRSEPA
jgi:endonuclease/exonuclease/phosphatase family metal-dependent hydrolase